MNTFLPCGFHSRLPELASGTFVKYYTNLYRNYQDIFVLSFCKKGLQNPVFTVK